MNLNILRRRRVQTHSEPIEMKERRYGYGPKVFRWRGHRYVVHHVDRCWTLPKRHRRNEGWRYFRVSCAEGKFVVYQDLEANTWHLSKANGYGKRKGLPMKEVSVL
jgi:hypothetical protein